MKKDKGMLMIIGVVIVYVLTVNILFQVFGGDLKDKKEERRENLSELNLEASINRELGKSVSKEDSKGKLKVVVSVGEISEGGYEGLEEQLIKRVVKYISYISKGEVSLGSNEGVIIIFEQEVFDEYGNSNKEKVLEVEVLSDDIKKINVERLDKVELGLKTFAKRYKWYL